jgi:hypothetical protein
VLDFVRVVVYILVGSLPSRVWYKSSDSFPTLERSTAISTNFFSELDSQALPDLHPWCSHRSLSCILVSLPLGAQFRSCTLRRCPGPFVQVALYYCTAGVRLAACVETRRKESSSGKSQTLLRLRYWIGRRTRGVAQLASPARPLPSRLSSAQGVGNLSIAICATVPPPTLPLSLPTSISPGGPDPRAVCASAPSSAKRTDAAARSVPVRSTPSLPCWVLGFKGTLEPAGLACCGRRWSGRSGPLFVTLAQGLLILYHLGRPPLVAELSLLLDAIPDTRTPLSTQTTTPLPSTTTTTPFSLLVYASLLRLLSLHAVSRLTIADLRPSGYSYRSHLHLRLSAAKVRA